MNAKKIAIISILGNLLLAGSIAYLLRQPPPPSVIVLETNASPRIIEKRVEVPVKVTEPFDWRKVESEDYRRYIANLRAIGCPEQTVRDIIVADVNALFEARRQALIQPPEDFKFWRADETPFFSSAPAQKLHEQFEQLRLLAEEKRAVLRELLGIEVSERIEAAFAPMNPREQLLTFLPMEKRLRLEEIEQRFSALLMKKVPDNSGHEQLGNYKKLQAEKRAEIQQLLTPGELEEYDLRFSSTAISLRAQLGTLNPSEQEFRDMVRMRKKFDEEFGDVFTFDIHDPGARQKRADGQRELDEQMKLLLGQKRYAEYQRERDWGYQSAVVTTENTGLPGAVAASIYEMKNIAEAEAEHVQADESLSPEARQNTLDEVRLAVEEAVLKVLGKDGYDVYQKQAGASWLRNLNREQAGHQASR